MRLWMIGVVLLLGITPPTYAKEWWGTPSITTIRPHAGATNTYVIERDGKTVGRIFVGPGKEYEIKDDDGQTLGTFTPSKPGGLGPWKPWR